MKSKSIWNAGPVGCGISEVVSPVADTYSGTFHQWLMCGSFASRILPTTCVYNCKVSRVSCQSATRIEGQRSGICHIHALPSIAPVLSLSTCAATGRTDPPSSGLKAPCCRRSILPSPSSERGAGRARQQESLHDL